MKGTLILNSSPHTEKSTLTAGSFKLWSHFYDDLMLSVFYLSSGVFLSNFGGNQVSGEGQLFDYFIVIWYKEIYERFI